jgi:hypothetical protein
LRAVNRRPRSLVSKIKNDDQGDQMTKLSVTIRLAALTIGTVWVSAAVQAANWFEVQTIPPPEFGKAELIGFVQPTYTDYQDNRAANGQIPKADLIAPDYGASDNWAVQRARLFVRGSLTPDITYYVGTEFGQNNYAYSFGHYSPRLIDADMVFSHFVPGVRFELGIIRAPGPEGGMQGFMDFSFLDLFPTAIGQLMQPSFVNKNAVYKGIANGGFAVPGSDLSGDNGFRYPGIQAMDWFRLQPNLELAYGVMFGVNGRQLEPDTANGSILASRVQLSYLFDDGRGRFFRNDLTGFLWYQHAHPELNDISNTMVRYGFGATYRRDYMKALGENLKVEYMRGTGDIAVPATFNVAPALQATQYDSTLYPDSRNSAHGYTITGGVFLTRNIELNARYDYYDRLPNIASQERVFKTTATGISYHFTPLTRLVLDYAFRKVEIPNPSAIGNAGNPALNLASSVVGAIGNEINLFAVVTFRE